MCACVGLNLTFRAFVRKRWQHFPQIREYLQFYLQTQTNTQQAQQQQQQQTNIMQKSLNSKIVHLWRFSAD